MPNPHLALWAALRDKASLAEIADMLRQDMEADGLDTEEIESVVAGLVDVAADTASKVRRTCPECKHDVSRDAHHPHCTLRFSNAR